MKLIVATVGNRPPDWVTAGWAEYAKRMPREMPLELMEIKPEPRLGGKTVAIVQAAEAHRIDTQIAPRCYRIALDEHGATLTTRQLADRLAKWMEIGRDVVFIVGGADGLDNRIKQGADETLRLSSLTLPHALVRVILAEALYRAHTLLRRHPYHRE